MWFMEGCATMMYLLLGRDSDSTAFRNTRYSMLGRTSKTQHPHTKDPGYKIASNCIYLRRPAANVKKDGARFGPGLNLSGDHLPEFIAIRLPTAQISHRNTRHVGIHRSRTPPIYTPQDLLYNPSTSKAADPLYAQASRGRFLEPVGVAMAHRCFLYWTTKFQNQLPHHLNMFFCSNECV